MRKISGIIFILFCLTLAGCHHKKPNIEPPAVPGAEQPAPPSEPLAPTPSQPPPAPPPRRTPSHTLDAPPVRPRVPSSGDNASLRIVEQGVKEMNAGQLDDAEQIFEQALRLSPSYGKPYYYLGVLSY